MKTFYKDVEEFQKTRDDMAFGRIVKRLTPNIRVSLRKTNLQEQDDLRQELNVIVYEKAMGYPLDEVPGFDEFEKNILSKIAL